MTVIPVSTPDGKGFSVGPGQPLLLIAGPCALESEDLARRVAGEMQEICARLGLSYVFKASFDKANRTSLDSYRGPGLEEGLSILSRIRNDMQVPVISDVHDVSQVAPAAEVLDIIQIPAFLCRQTDLLVAAAKTDKPINLKKGQFVSPWDMENGVNKLRGAGGTKTMLVERGASFGYNNLVVDMRSLPVMRGFGCPVIYDATHSVQLPGVPVALPAVSGNSLPHCPGLQLQQGLTACSWKSILILTKRFVTAPTPCPLTGSKNS